MLKFLIFPAIAILAYAYRLRGGGYYNLGNTTLARFCWSGALAAGYAMIANTDISFIYTGTLIVTGFLSMLIPHAYCQNMGRWATPQKKWPSFFLPTISPATWTAWPMWKRTGYDVISMAAIGFIRGIIVFWPYIAIALTSTAFTHGFEEIISRAINVLFGVKVFSYSIFGAIAAILTITILSPAAYVIGFYIPISLPSNGAKSTEWGETLTGFAWAISVILLLI